MLSLYNLQNSIIKLEIPYVDTKPMSIVSFPCGNSNEVTQLSSMADSCYDQFAISLQNFLPLVKKRSISPQQVVRVP